MLKFLYLSGIILYSFAAQSTTGMILSKSSHGFKETVIKIEKFISSKKLTLFAKIDHSKNAINAGLKLPQNTLFIFGNPKVGTPIMSAAPSAGIDFPVKIHVFTNKSGHVTVSYNDPDYLAKRHKVPANLKPLKKMKGLLKKLTQSLSQ